MSPVLQRTGLFLSITPNNRAHALSLVAHHAPAMHPDPTRLITFRDFLDNRQGLECYCPGCRRTAYTDVAMLVLNDLEDRNVKGYRPRCRKCGRPAAVTPLMPQNRCCNGNPGAGRGLESNIHRAL